MPHHHVTDFEKPTRLDPPQRAEVLAEARARILELATDGNGNVHRGEVLDALTDDDAT